MRKLLVSLVVLLILLLIADRVGAAVASRAVSAEVRASAQLASADVTVGGFPFLTQAVAGRYDKVEVAATQVVAGQLTLARLDATLSGVRVPLSDALSGAVDSVPVDSVRATALVGYAELSRRSGNRRLTVAPAGDRVRVTGSVQVLGRTVSAVAVSRVEVVEGDLLVTAESYEVGNQRADDLISRALGGRFDLRLPVTGLPYGLEVTGVTPGPDGVAVSAAAASTVLSPVAVG